MFKTSATSLIISAALAGGAFAQTNPAPAAPAASAPAMSGQFVTDQDLGQFRASKIVGLAIYGPDDKRIGDVNEVLVDGTGQARTVVIGVGGFLGIGEKNVAVPFGQVQWVNTRSIEAAAATTGSVGGAVNTAPMTGGMTAAPTTSAVPARSPAEQAAYNGYPDHGKVAMTKADLQNAPTFRYYADTHPATGASNAVSPTKP